MYTSPVAICNQNPNMKSHQIHSTCGVGYSCKVSVPGCRAARSTYAAYTPTSPSTSRSSINPQRLKTFCHACRPGPWRCACRCGLGLGLHSLTQRTLSGTESFFFVLRDGEPCIPSPFAFFRRYQTLSLSSTQTWTHHMSDHDHDDDHGLPILRRRTRYYKHTYSMMTNVGWQEHRHRPVPRRKEI
ncbi:hypothetical protein OG21DRAFT_1027626 [Imleria badia]|nr:hypothetical protein OG21DRAFT_1027626 [Imleria badia]